MVVNTRMQTRLHTQREMFIDNLVELQTQRLASLEMGYSVQNTVAYIHRVISLVNENKSIVTEKGFYYFRVYICENIRTIILMMASNDMASSQEVSNAWQESKIQCSWGVPTYPMMHNKYNPIQEERILVFLEHARVPQFTRSKPARSMLHLSMRDPPLVSNLCKHPN
jgi:hypothetical protein